MLIAFNKPYGVLTQFTDQSMPPRRTLSEFGLPKDVYAAGRLDIDSEGLLLLSDDGARIAQISSPKFKWPKTYLVHVEGHAEESHLAQLRAGTALNAGMSLPATARVLDKAPDWLWLREPPIRVRTSLPESWLELTIKEGRNRQVRRMCAAIGLPCLRLVRISVGPHRLDGLAPGHWREEEG